jgi:site-specific recombinase XerD
MENATNILTSAERGTAERDTALVPWIVSPDAVALPGQAPFQFDEADRIQFEKRARDRAIDDSIKGQKWPEAYAAWIAGGWKSHGKRISEQTRRAYTRSIMEFAQFIGRTPMWRVEGSQVIAWQNDMRERGLSEATINLRLSGLSSLYDFCMNHFPYSDPFTGETAYLLHRNPVEAANRAKVEAYKSNKSIGLNEDEVLAMLRKVNRATVEGLRDYALLVTLFLTGQRSAAIGELKWGDIVHPKGETDVIYYRWMSKAKEGTDELLRPAYEAICAYLAAAGRLEAMGKDDYIFVALSDASKHLDEWRARTRGTPMPDRTQSRPLTGARINTIVKRSARRAGLDDSFIHTHTLRHTAALFMKRHGTDLVEISRTLHHSNVNTTMIYLNGLEHDRHPLWKSVGAFFEMV